MRIAMIAACPFPWPRGTPIRIHRMAEALGARGHEVHVVTYHLGQDSPLPQVHVHRVPGPAWYTRTTPGPSVTKLAILDPMLASTLRRLLRQHEFDVIHAHHYEGLATALLARHGRKPPIVFDAHTLLETELPGYANGWRARLGRRAGLALDRSLPRRADQVIAVTDEIAARLAGVGCVPRDRIAMISNGVEIDHFSGDDEAVNGTDVLAFAGNVAPYQRIDLLLQAFARIRDRRPSARLAVLTADDFRAFDTLMRDLALHDHVDVIDAGYAGLPSHLRRATVLANPRVECSGIPQKLLNYMASGTPVVSFAGSAKLLLDGESGLVVRNGDVDGFAAAVLRLMDDPALRRALAARALDAVSRDHSWPQVAARVEQVYARAVVGR